MPHETPFENDPSGMVKRWLTELRQADKSEKDWRERSRKIVHRYRDDEEDNRKDRRYNILWANTETLKPQLFSQTPEPVVQRRFHNVGQQDPIGREVAKTLERGLEYALDAYDFDGTIERVVLDHLLTGRGLARIRYIPTFEVGDAPEISVQQEVTEEGEDRLLADLGQGPTELNPERVRFNDVGDLVTDGEPEEEVVYEEVRCEYVNWEDFRLSPARTWEEVRWIAFRHRMTREELVETFGAKGRDVPLDFNPQEETSKDEDADEIHISKRATVWEIWDKENRELKFISEAKKDGPVDVRPDPLNLGNFYPIPKPLYSVPTNNTMVPVPEFTLYQDQAIELNHVTTRIDKLVDALKARGLYAGEAGDALSRLMDADDNELIPVEDFASVAQGGTLEGKIAWLPIEQIAKTILELRRHRAELLETIYEVTGISDIMRGATDPRETRGAQQLKGQFGVMRMQPRQKRVQHFLREILELKAEVMAEMFSPETLSLMTGVQQPEPALEMLRDERLRGFRIDIETDSTIAADEQSDKREMSEFMQGLAGFTQQVVPAIQTGVLNPEAAKELIKFALKKFRVSRSVEEAFEMPAQPPQQQPDPIEMAKIQNDKLARETDRMKVMIEAQDKQAQRQIDIAKLQQQRSEAEDENERHAIDTTIELMKESEQTFREAMSQVAQQNQQVGEG